MQRCSNSTTRSGGKQLFLTVLPVSKHRQALGRFACLASGAGRHYLGMKEQQKMTMNQSAGNLNSARQADLNNAANNAAFSSQPRQRPPDRPTDNDDEAQELPVSPDEGAPLIPDDERVIDVPS